MTGFGRAIKSYLDKTIIVEIKSLNSKYADLNLRIPSAYKDKEPVLRKEITAILESGKIDLNVSIERANQEAGLTINKVLAKNYFKQLNSLCDELEIPKDDLLSKILRMPDIISNGKEEPKDETEWKKLYHAIIEAMKALNEFRKTEGANLEKDILHRIEKIEKSIVKIKKNESSRISIIRKKIASELNEVISKEKIDNNRFEQEIIYYLEKLDITEEIVRLKSHCDYFKEIVHEKSSSKGKKLSFITQEIGREINTIGSKANHVPIQKNVVEMKDELEKIKEQLGNVL